MAHSLSAKKRVRQNAKDRLVNRARKSRVRKQIKRFEAALTGGSADAANEQFRQVARTLDKTAATSAMHKKTAARKKSRLAKRLNSLAANKVS